MKQGAAALGTDVDGLCQQMSTLTKDGEPYGLAQRLKKVIEAKEVS